MTAPSEETTEQETDDGETGLLHKWCRRCVPPLPRAATALCGYKTVKRRADGDVPPWPECVVCASMERFGCSRCGGSR